jgi:ankyrin repeat protein
LKKLNRRNNIPHGHRKYMDPVKLELNINKLFLNASKNPKPKIFNYIFKKHYSLELKMDAKIIKTLAKNNHFENLHKFSLTHSDEEYNFLLMWAIRYCNVKYVKFLLDKSFNISQDEEIGLSLTHQWNNKKLPSKCQQDQAEIFSMLLNKGYKTIRKELYYRCAKYDFICLLEAIEDNFEISNKVRDEGFVRACVSLSTKVAKYLFQYNLSSKQKIFTSVIQQHDAGKENNKKLYKILCLLLSDNSELRAPISSLVDILRKSSDIKHDEYLLKVFELLIDNGADVNYSGAWALIHACSRDYLSIAKLLIKKGSRVDVRDDHPVILACRNGDLELLKYLVEERNLSVKGSWRREPIDMVRGNKEMTAYIKSVLEKEKNK